MHRIIGQQLVWLLGMMKASSCQNYETMLHWPKIKVYYGRKSSVPKQSNSITYSLQQNWRVFNMSFIAYIHLAARNNRGADSARTFKKAGG